MTSNEIISTYERMGALLRGHFLLSSGLHSDAYLQSEKVLMYPNVAAQVVAPLVQNLKNIKFNTIVSPAIGGIRFGYELARQMGKPAIFTERADGNMTLRRGFEVTQGERVVIAEDVITTGKSTKECMAAVESLGAIVVGIATIIDRSNGMANFGDIPFFPLAKIEVKSYEPSDCPMCKTGGTPIKPGSRQLALRL